MIYICRAISREGVRKSKHKAEVIRENNVVFISGKKDLGRGIYVGRCGLMWRNDVDMKRPLYMTIS